MGVAGGELSGGTVARKARASPEFSETALEATKQLGKSTGRRRE